MHLLEFYDQKELRHLAAGFEEYALGGEGDNIDNYVWQYVPNMPLGSFVSQPDYNGNTHSTEDWTRWFRGEVESEIENNSYSTWEDLLFDAVETPIIVSVPQDGKMLGWDIWDGWHRTGASISAGRKIIPTILGVRKK